MKTGAKIGIGGAIGGGVVVSALFLLASSHTFVTEGGCVDDPLDLGGRTNFGVTERVARHHGYEGDVCEMTREEAEVIAYLAHWNGRGYEWLSAMPEVALELYDTDYNTGRHRESVRWLQDCLNLLNNRGRFYPDIAVDGHLGQETGRALAAYRRSRPPSLLRDDGRTVLMTCIEGAQIEYYKRITRSRHDHEKYLYGWLRTRIGNTDEITVPDSLTFY